jgi:serine/threonine protein kinase/WD40 repeat protein
VTSPLLGRTLGEFQVKEQLASGGFGEVFRAEQAALGREAVIKTLHVRHRESQLVVQRFLREAKLASRFDHPYAAHVYAFGAEPDGTLWIAMELVRGTPLDKLLAAQGAIPLARFVPLFERIGEVVQAAHEAGIVHRDLKPGNVMVLARAGRLLPKLLDFGIAKTDGGAAESSGGGVPQEPGDEAFATTMDAQVSTDDQPSPLEGETQDESRLTHAGAALGSPLYMAPEQWADASAVGPPSDLYALGVLAYEALTLRPPFTAKTMALLARAHATAPVPPLGDGLPPALDGVFARALAKDPKERFPSAMAMVAAFREAAGLGGEPVVLPALDEGVRSRALTDAPQPLAEAVAALDGAGNAHQARDALWQITGVAARLVGVLALSARLASALRADAGDRFTEIIRRLRREAFSDEDWLEAARVATHPFRGRADAHPLPELVRLLEAKPGPFAPLLALRSTPAATDGQARELLGRALPHVAELLSALAFLADYPLVVWRGDHAELWMGVRRSVRPRTSIRGAKPAVGQAAIIDRDGAAILSLAPLVQVGAPTPGAADHLFLVEGKGRRGARLVSFPEGFEREDEALWDELRTPFLDTTDEEDGKQSVEHAPFRGLAPFTTADASDYFGREREVEEVVNRLRVQTLVAVVGPSGAGKSSFVHAGVLAALPEAFRAESFRPGAHPLRALAAHLGAQVIVVDQLEEVFTLCEDPGERAAFAEELARLADSGDQRIIVTLRDDFLIRAEGLPGLRLGAGLVLLGTPARDDLLRILRRPLERVGYELDDPALAEEMVDEVAAMPGALALLSFAASKLWAERDRHFRQLRRKAYVAMGGVGGALAQHAEATLAQLRPEEQRLVRVAFQHLVTGAGTRTVVGRKELTRLIEGKGEVLERLISARLLVASEDAAGEERIEVIHEALLGAWPRLVEWRREDAEGSRLRDQLRTAATQWQERGRAKGLLWRGDALAEYEVWRKRRPAPLTSVEEEFAAASVADAARGRRMLVGSSVVLLVALVAGLAVLFAAERKATTAATKLDEQLAAQYFDQGRRALLEHDAVRAVPFLAGAWEHGVRGPEIELLLSLAKERLRGPVLTLQADGAVYLARITADGKVVASTVGDAAIWTAEGRLVNRVRPGGRVYDAILSSDGQIFLVAFEGGVRAYRAADLALLHSWPGPAVGLDIEGARAFVFRLNELTAISPATGQTSWTLPFSATLGFHASPFQGVVVVADEAGAIHAVDAETGERRWTTQAHQGAVTWIDVAPDGSEVLSAGADGRIRSFRFSNGEPLIETKATSAGILAVRWSPDGKLLASTSADGAGHVWDGATGELKATLRGHDGEVPFVGFTADGKQLVTAGRDGTLRIWIAGTGVEIAVLRRHAGAISWLVPSPDGKRFVTSDYAGRIVVWELERHMPDTRVLPVVATRSLALTGDGRRVALTTPEGVEVLDLGRGRNDRLPIETGAFRVRWAPAEDALVVAGNEGIARLWVPGGPTREIPASDGRLVDAALSQDGRVLVTATMESVRSWATANGELSGTFGTEGVIISASLSPSAPIVVTTGAGLARVWDLSNRAPLGELPMTGIVRGDFADDGTFYTAGLGVIAHWRLLPSVELVSRISFTGQAVSTAVTDHFVLAATTDGQTHVWSQASGQLLLTLEHGVGVREVSASRDLRTIGTTVTANQAYLWRLPRDEWNGDGVAALREEPQ